MDSKIMKVTEELSVEFPYNEDMNSGSPIGVGERHRAVCLLIGSRLNYSQAGHSLLSRTALALALRLLISNLHFLPIGPTSMSSSIRR